MHRRGSRAGGAGQSARGSTPGPTADAVAARADGLRCDAAMPPASRTHRVPTAGDTPASAAASSLGRPAAIATQNRRCSSCRRTEGRPGECSLARPARAEHRLRVVIATPSGEVLRRPLEFTLAALIRVMNDVRRPTLRDGHIQRGQDELSPEMGFHRPADHASAPDIEDDGEIEEAGPGRHVGDVRDPQLIRARAGELAVDEIRRRPGRLVAHRRAERLPPAHALQPGAPHQPGHPLTANVEAAGGELGMNPGDAVGPARLAMDRLDLRGEFHIGPGAGRQRPLAPGEVPAGGDTQHAAQPGDRMEGLMGGHELESLDGLEVVSRANQAAAFFRISRSSRSCRTSRRSRRTSSRFSVVRPSVRWPASSAACCTQFLIGWAMETHISNALVLAALHMAVAQRRPMAVIHHSDHGCQYTSVAFGERCADAGVRPSMGSVGDAYDNALCESFFATLECELLDQHRFRTQIEARLAIFDFIEGWYNSRRRHSALDYRSPTIFERSKERDDRTAPAGSTIDQGGAISISPPRPCGEQSRKQFTVHRTGATPYLDQKYTYRT